MHTTDVSARRGAAAATTAALFTITIFLSASLLFFVQPLFAKIVLPQIGGAPAVWTTAMLFFQCVLTGGYLYAHLVTRYLRPRLQMMLHLAVWAAALQFLPLGIPEGWQFDSADPAAWQALGLFAVGVGVPFAVLSANAPLIQCWYARSDGPSADDPYFLYGASNLGSLIALLAFPLAAEPLFGAAAIGRGWAMGFLALGAFLLLSGLAAGNAPAAAPRARELSPLSAAQIGRWLLLAFVPSSLMLAVTTKISTDLGAVPLLWVIPLALYLLTFVLTFARRPLVLLGGYRWVAMPGLAILGLVFLGLTGPYLSWTWAAALSAGFFAVALFAHRLLYEARPDESRLTLFYVTMSVGGALGGLFNSIVAPVIFDGLYEGSLTTLVAALLLVRGWAALDRRRVAQALGTGMLATAPVALAVFFRLAGNIVEIAGWLIAGLIVAMLALRRSRPAAALAAAVAALSGSVLLPDTVLHRDRSFFGTHTVLDQGRLRLYSHGTTVHGAQRLGDFDAGVPEPLFYYHRNGPMAQILTSARGRAARRVGIIGQGVGSLVCYRQPGQNWAFYEIDPVVDRIARDPALFSFMSRCAGDAPTYLGDARVVLGGQPDRRYDILVIDAYSSGAVPVHLTTLEAMQLYLDRLAPGGLLVFHVSNIFYEIDHPIARSAAALGLDARLQRHRGALDAEPGDAPSSVMAIARQAADFGALANDPRWRPLRSDGGAVWTDDHANLLSIIRRRAATRAE